MDRSLVRHVGGGHRRILIIAGSIAAGVACATVVLLWWSRLPSLSRCEYRVRQSDWSHGVETCLASYDRTGDASNLAWAARAHLALGEVDEAERLARRLLPEAHYGDARAILSYIALQRGLPEVAKLHASIALAAHTFAKDARGRATDVVLLSQVAWRAGDFTSALQAADDALGLVQQLSDPHLEMTASVARADALRRMGDTRSAAITLASALERATSPCDTAWLHLKSGMCQMEAGQARPATVELMAAEQANRACASPYVSKSISINLAWLLRSKDPPGAIARLEQAEASTGEGFETLLLRAYLAADRGALDEALGDLGRAERAGAGDADWSWELERARAELLELRGGALGDLLAEYHYRRAMAMVAALRGTARARSAYLVSSHRAPYDGLIALLARHGRWRDALAVILELDASDMLRATANETEPHDRARLDVGGADPRSITRPPPPVDRVLVAWRARDLVIVIAQAPRQIGAGHERAYRLRITGGQVTGEDVGDAAAARALAARLFGDPDDQDTARALGPMIVPRDPADGPLHVLAVGALGKLPLAALRDAGGSLVIARRPLVRVLGLEAIGPESSGDGRSVILADPLGDLQSAAAEGAMVAEALGPGAQISGTGMRDPATLSLLWQADNADLLHVAGHVRALGRWRELHLADGGADPAEMVRRHFAPRIAVLASCGSAAAMDEEGWGSIAAALLESGTAVVVATDRSVGDAAALTVMRGFYAQPDWRTDPARALARVQQALAAGTSPADEATRAQSWAAFAVLRRAPVVVP